MKEIATKEPAMKANRILVKITEANAKANEYMREAEITGDTKLVFLALGYRMEVARLMKKVA